MNIIERNRHRPSYSPRESRSSLRIEEAATIRPRRENHCETWVLVGNGYVGEDLCLRRFTVISGRVVILEVFARAAPFPRNPKLEKKTPSGRHFLDMDFPRELIPSVVFLRVIASFFSFFNFGFGGRGRAAARPLLENYEATHYHIEYYKANAMEIGNDVPSVSPHLYTQVALSIFRGGSRENDRVYTGYPTGRQDHAYDEHIL